MNETAAARIILVTGAKQVIYNAMMASLNPGDEVIVPAPYWVSYVDIVRIAGGEVVSVPCSEAQGFRLSPESLERAIMPRTRWLILNGPSNPTGATYADADLRALIEVLKAHPHVWLLSDDIYERLLYDDRRFATAAALDEEIKRRTLTVNGVSKAYAMTGWRLGYAGGPKPLISAMAVVQSQSTSCPSSISQAAAIAALRGPQDFLDGRRRSFQERRDLVVRELNAMRGIRCRAPEGAFYTFASCGDLMGTATPAGARLRTDSDFADYLLQHWDVAVVPGSALGRRAIFESRTQLRARNLRRHVRGWLRRQER